ncbi:MAG: 3-oxoacyl-(acyl-carrier-protein) synthase [Burkholderiales bacterium]|jgi:3-oxoacyl-[acyl-carrier-protein] synthase-3|nr:3-oxoacyl-(acyl-carrier-protein) synthase [Burkholderiales bacterium]
MIYSRIAGTGSYLPPRVMTNAEFAARLDTSDAWIRERTGIVQRHIAEKSQSSSDLALQASARALEASGLTASQVDLIIVATSTPDYIFPSTACLLQAKLGVKGCPAFDVQAVCSGFVYGMATADALIRSGQYKSALVVGAEVFSRILDWDDRGTCVLFGDGAGAVVLTAAPQPGIHASVLHADGSQVDLLSVPGNVCGGAIVGSPFLQMNGQGVFKFAVRVLEEAARETVAAAGMQLGDIDWLIPHQANVRILEATARRLGLPPEKLVVTVDRHGNTSAASIPLALDEFVRAGKIRPGHRVLMEGVGGGFTWGASLATL